ncbi:capsule biosynthesis protein [Stappia indica]|uniref:Capsular polysaccharide export protein n=1 Tax=Stappia indica TaxID=538381 RepID=A0A285RQD4_9HYPH|nr:capsular biosynthesis protein [Stappia indica]SOB96331.1 capsular polysaccharide export protein [Stappia indica]
MPGAAEPRGSRARRFLFLQGPLSPLYRRIGARLAEADHQVTRVNFCVGDWLHWHGRECRFWRGRLADWPAEAARLMEEGGVTDLVLHGDTRPYHRPAVLAAEARGINVHVSELGLVRPGYMTLARGGLGVLSRLPDDPAIIRRVAARLTDPDLSPRYPGSFALEAWQDVSYHLPNVAGFAVHPFYRRHTPSHPLVDYLSWIRRLAGEGRRKREAARIEAELLAGDAPLFLLPLQVEGDYQILAHSHFGTMRAALGHVIAAFRGGAPKEARLVVKAHPLDNGEVDWRAEIARHAGGDAERMVFLDGGSLAALFPRLSGLVTVNSTAGLDALRAGVPVAVLTPALYDMAGLTHRGPLERFWQAPQPPDPALLADFLKVVVASSQLRGSIHNREGLDEAVETMTARLLDETVPDPDWHAEAPPRLARARAMGVPL